MSDEVRSDYRAPDATEDYPVIDATGFTVLSDESLGTKTKVWLEESPMHARYLFKYSRPGTGEHWSEKIAAEIAGCLGVPHAQAELATRGGAAGVLSMDLTDRGNSGALQEGNALLHEEDVGYEPAAGRDRGKTNRRARHTVARVLTALEARGIRPPARFDCDGHVTTAADVFVGYLLLDALIGNTDRHHENWAILQRPSDDASSRGELAASYDHASSLGRELRDERRRLMIDRGVGDYCDNRSAFFELDGDARPISCVRAFRVAAADRRSARIGWLMRLQRIGWDDLVRPIRRVPEPWMSVTAKEFATAVLKFNRDTLLNLEA